MPYTPTVWQDGVTMGNQTRMNNIESIYTEATNSFEQDLFSAFVFSGLVCTKDGTIANQLDVTAGIAFLKQTDSTLRRRAPASSNQTTATPSTTYYLFLNTDGTWTWGTTSSGPANCLAICQVTTDASGNILAITDERALNTTLFSGMAGELDLPVLYNGLSVATGTTSLDNGGVTTNGSGSLTATGIVTASSLDYGAGVSGSKSQLTWDGTNHQNVFWTPQSGATALGHLFVTWNGSAQTAAFSVGGRFGLASGWVDNSGNFNGPAGGGLPITRNNTAGSTPIYTGSTSPTNPPTGSIWVKA